MAAEDDEILREFLLESSENLSRLDQEMVQLEQNPDSQDLLGSIFRTIHTIKGTCGFFGYNRLQALAHVTEDILNELRHKRWRLDAPLTSLILQSVDGIKRMLESIEAGGEEGENFEGELLARLEQARDGKPHPSPQPEPAAEPSPAPDSPPPAEVPEAAAPDHAAAGPSKASALSETALRVDVGLLDRLMNLVGELVLTRNQVLQYNTSQEDCALNAITQRLNLITTELQEGVMKTRMQPIGLVWNKLPRVVRDLATSLGKEIDLDMEGAETELDRTIIEAIKDPLTHIVRNSCDHGIERPELRIRDGKPARGRLSLRAYHEGGQVNIEIADDGAGIDPARVKAKALERQLIGPEQVARMTDRDLVNLVFLPGFSTAAQVTNVSGRGVGMDVVKTHIERIGGAVDLLSEPGRGTTVRVRIPLTLAIIPGLVVSAGGERFVVPQVNLHELIRLESDQADSIGWVHETPVFRSRNTLLPLANLSQVLGLQPRRSGEEINIVVLQADEGKFALVVDQIGDSEEIVVKPLGRQLKNLNCFAGATIMGDGAIALILDVPGLGLRAGVLGPNAQAAAATAPQEAAAEGSRNKSLLLCRAGSLQRLAIPLSQVARLEQIAAADLRMAAGRRAVQYRRRILPLLDIAEMLGGASAGSDMLNVVVYRSGTSEVGLVVDEILDIFDEAICSPYASDRPGLLGSAIVAGELTDFLDTGAVAEWASPSSAGDLSRLETVLFGETLSELAAEVEA